MEQKEAKHKDREEIPEPGPPSRPPISRLIGTLLDFRSSILKLWNLYELTFIVVPDPHPPSRPLPPTPQQIHQQPAQPHQRNSHLCKNSVRNDQNNFIFYSLFLFQFAFGLNYCVFLKY